MLKKLMIVIIAMAFSVMCSTLSEAATLQKDAPAEVKEVVPPTKVVYTLNRRGNQLKEHKATYRADYMGIVCALQPGQLVLINDDTSLFEMEAQVSDYNRISPNRKVALVEQNFSALTHSEKETYKELAEWTVFSVQVTEKEPEKPQKVKHDAMEDAYNVSNILSQIKMISQY